MVAVRVQGDSVGAHRHAPGLAAARLRHRERGPHRTRAHGDAPLRAIRPTNPSLSNRDVLLVWERGQGRGPFERALAILDMAYPGGESDRLPIGARDSRLFAVREAIFGKKLDCLATCPKCGETTELALDSTELRSGSTEPSPVGDQALHVDGWEIRFRLPNSRDLTAALVAQDPSESQRRLIERCVVGLRKNGKSRPSSALTDEVFSHLSAEMSRLDPGAELELVLTCPGCGARWLSPFDIASYLWTEIDALAKRLLREVATLAQAYGWREPDILTLSPTRRQAYLDLI